MGIVADYKQISADEKVQINRQVKEDLVDHLYQGCLPGTISGMIASVVLFLDYYGYTPTHLLVIWIVLFNVMMLALTALFFLYLKYKSKMQLNKWEWAYSITMSGCAIVWVPAIYLIPADITRQYLALIAFFLATTGYATGTIGQFKLCVLTLNIMLIPLIIWCFFKGGIFYNIIAIFAMIYMSFMLSINYRSTRWFIDSLKLKLENTLVTFQANHDLLTGLPNQHFLPQYLHAAIHNSTEKNLSFALISFSLNRMEMINDSLGHQTGNAVIKAVATRLTDLALNQNKLPNSPQYIVTISRKDTFNIIVIPYQAEQFLHELKNIFSVLDELFYLELKGVKLTASAGVSVFPQDGQDGKVLLKNADAAMLQAKQFGGNRYEFYRAEINAAAPRRLEMENDLHLAIKKNEFVLFYQPLVAVKTGKIVGAEALIRWPHRTHGLISPMQFIPVAEETGLIIPIGEWVLKEACKQAKHWQKIGFSSFKISVNVSAKQLRRKDYFIEEIKDTLNTLQFNPQMLEIELTETAILDESIIPTIKAFKQLGLSLAVDDFGTGYSGLSYLKRFSIDKLKIDQSFIRDIPSNNESITIVSAILAMARELKVGSLAEGVETQEQFDFLKDKKCDFVQGYFFSKPLDSIEFTKLLQKQHETV